MEVFIVISGLFVLSFIIPLVWALLSAIAPYSLMVFGIGGSLFICFVFFVWLWSKALELKLMSHMDYSKVVNKPISYTTPTPVQESSIEDIEFLVFTQHQCLACEALKEAVEATLLINPRGVTWLPLETAKGVRLMARYDVTTLPTIIRIDKGGDEVERLEGPLVFQYATFMFKPEAV